MGVIAGADGPLAIGVWAENNERWLRQRLQLPTMGLQSRALWSFFVHGDSISEHDSPRARAVAKHENVLSTSNPSRSAATDVSSTRGASGKCNHRCTGIEPGRVSVVL